MFAWFATAWIVPSLSRSRRAPAQSRSTSDGVAVSFGSRFLVVPTTLVLVQPLRRMRPPERAARPSPAARSRRAPLAAAAVLGLNLAGQVSTPWDLVLAAAATLVVLVALRPPCRPGRCASPAGCRPWSRARAARRRVLRRRGVPALPAHPALRLLADAGRITLTAAAITWAAASWVRAARRPAERPRRGRIGRCWSRSASAAPAWSPPRTHRRRCSSSRGPRGAGMGPELPAADGARARLLPARHAGTNSSSLTIADSTGAAWSLAVTGLVFNAAAGLD